MILTNLEHFLKYQQLISKGMSRHTAPKLSRPGSEFYNSIKLNAEVINTIHVLMQSLFISLSRSISTLARRHSLSSSIGSTAAILDCSVVVPRSLRSPLFPRTVHEIVARRVERRHDELKGNTTS